ncbi:MAG: YggS family pyridoxal phosphate-dependent enzyme [Actinomycetota bacterium]|nr:YggS family pyridoxal phosphate-dependent enzyme [Actinomycetota bacterium]
MREIAKNVSEIKRQAKEALSHSNLPTKELTIVAAAKAVSSNEVMEAISAGVIDIGENRAEEMVEKFGKIGPKARWHFIGHLQRNKVKKIIGIADMIHSVDSLRLAEAIDSEAKRVGKVQDVLLEINVSKEKSKFGFDPDVAKDFLKNLSELKNIRIKGLMTVPPLQSDPELNRDFFRRLRSLMDEINDLKVLKEEMTILSMGMSQDYKIAIEEGANMVRIGTGIFGARGCMAK